MNVLDIAQNSVRAKATLIRVSLVLDTEADTEILCVTDNGTGMSEEVLRRVTDPFTTSRTTRKVGLGLPLLKMAAEQTGGCLSVKSRPGEGTAVTAVFGLSHIDLAPLGDIGGTVSALVGANPHIDFVFSLTKDGESFTFDTREARAILDGVPLSEPSVAVFIKEHVAEGTAEVLEGPKNV